MNDTYPELNERQKALFELMLDPERGGDVHQMNFDFGFWKFKGDKLVPHVFSYEMPAKEILSTVRYSKTLEIMLESGLVKWVEIGLYELTQKGLDIAESIWQSDSPISE